MMDNMLMMLNQNKVLWGISMLLLNIGSRYVLADLGKSHDYILSNQVVKKIVVMAMFFVATRDILTSFLLTISYILIIDGILHEKRSYCLLPKSVLESVNQTKPVSDEDYQRARNLITAYEEQKQLGKSENKFHHLERKKEYINYLTNLAMIKHSN